MLIALLLVVFLVDTAAMPAAQASTDFGSCRWWVRQKRQADESKDLMKEALEMYRVGYAQGFVEGLGASPVAYFGILIPDGVPYLAPLHESSSTGFSRVLQRPAILVQAFDEKCGDYRNESLQLADVGLLATLELGGIRSSQVAEAFEMLRGSGSVTARRQRAFEALARR